MYEIAGPGNTLGAISLPSWLKTAIGSVAGAVLKDRQVTIPTGAGTMTVDLSDPTALARLEALVRGIKLTRKPTDPPPAPSAGPSNMFGMPGGMVGIGLGALALYLIARRK